MAIRPFRSTLRMLAAVSALLLLVVACGGDDAPEPVEEPAAEEPAEPEGEPDDANGDEPAEEEGDPAAQRHELYYGASELFLPEHPVDDYLVDYYASLDPVDEIIAWFERNAPDFDSFTVEDEVVNGERRWVIDRAEAPEGEAVRVEIAHSEAHADLGFIAPIADVLPPGTIIIAVAYAG